MKALRTLDFNFIDKSFWDQSVERKNIRIFFKNLEYK